MQQRSELAQRVVERLKELGISQSEAARRAGFNRAYLSDLLSGKKANLHQNNYRRLAKALEMDLRFLMTGKAPSSDESLESQDFEAPSETVEQFEIPEEDLQAIFSMSHLDNNEREHRSGVHELKDRILSKPVPVYRSAGGRLDGAVLISEETVESVPRPISATISDHWYVVSLSEDSMSPRFEPGEFLYVRAEKFIRPRDYVVIQVEEKVGTKWLRLGYVRRFLREADGEYIVTRLHPIEEERYPVDRVLSMDRILMTCEPSL